ncbi:MAG: hypothetical protein LBH74_08430, partial [Nitrososphaerota archaeon]|nr:hypothetical protein [Nitrososphaerota archaeon]
MIKNMNSKCLNLKVKSRNFHRKITVMSVVSLLFMMLLVSSPLVSVFNEFSPFASACVYYNVTVNGSYATITGAGSYEACKTVTLNAGTRDGYTFSGWTVNAGGMKLKSNTSPTTTFVMPAKNVVVTANWTPIQYSILYALNGGVNAPSNPAS